MRHSEVASCFVDKISANGSRMFCKDTDEGFTVFSYGEHFPIARHTAYGFVFNSDDYSSSTATHKGYVERVLYGTVIKLPNCDETKASVQLKYDETELEVAQKKLSKVRTERMADYWVSVINDLKENIRLIKEHILPNQVMEALE